MKNNNGKDNSFLVQAGILAAAGIISRMIGLLYRSPLHRIIGDLGLGYYQSAYNFYTIILLISTYSIPAAISKVIAQKLALKEYRNAHRTFLCALGYVLVVGAAASLLLFFGAGMFVKGAAIPVLRTFAPTIFIYGILGVLRGYFQAHKSMAQTSVSQILEQIANAVVSVGAAYILIRVSFPDMEAPTDDEGMVLWGTRGAVGSALGTGAGVLVALLFMLWMYKLNSSLFRRRIRRSRHEKVESVGAILKTITMVVMPFLLSTAVYNLSGTVNNAVYTDIFPSVKELDSVVTYSRWGIFSGQALTIVNIPVAFSSAMAAAMLPAVAQLMAARDVAGAKEKIRVAVKTTMIVSIPCAVGLFVLARPVIGLLFQNASESEDLATGLLMALSVSVVFTALSTLSCQVLQGLGKLVAPIVNAGIALGIQSVLATLLLFFTDLDLYGIAIAHITYSVVMTVLNYISMYNAVKYRQEIVRTFLIPFIAAGFMGVAARLVYQGLLDLTKSPRLSVIPAIGIGAILYFALIVLFRGVTESELRGFPKGHLLVRIAKKLRLMR